VKYKLKISPKVLKWLNRFHDGLWAALMLVMWCGVWFDWMNYELFSAFLFNQAAWGRDSSCVAICRSQFCGATTILSFRMPHRFVIPYSTKIQNKMSKSSLLNVLLAIALVILSAKTLFNTADMKDHDEKVTTESAVLDNIKTRTSIRAYENREIEDDKVETLLQAAMAAPTAWQTSSHGSLSSSKTELTLDTIASPFLKPWQWQKMPHWR